MSLSQANDSRSVDARWFSVSMARRSLVLTIIAFSMLGGVLTAMGRQKALADVGYPSICVRKDLSIRYQWVPTPTFGGALETHATLGTEVTATMELTREVPAKNGGTKWEPMFNHRVTFGFQDIEDGEFGDEDLFTTNITDMRGRVTESWTQDSKRTEHVVSKIVYCAKTYLECVADGGTQADCTVGPTEEAIDNSGDSPELGLCTIVSWIAPGTAPLAAPLTCVTAPLRRSPPSPNESTTTMASATTAVATSSSPPQSTSTSDTATTATLGSTSTTTSTTSTVASTTTIGIDTTATEPAPPTSTTTMPSSTTSTTTMSSSTTLTTTTTVAADVSMSSTSSTFSTSSLPSTDHPNNMSASSTTLLATTTPANPSNSENPVVHATDPPTSTIAGATSVADRTSGFLGPTLVYPVLSIVDLTNQRVANASGALRSDEPQTASLGPRSLEESPANAPVDEGKASIRTSQRLNNTAGVVSGQIAIDTNVEMKNDARVLGLAIAAPPLNTASPLNTSLSGALAFTGASSILLGLVALVLLLAGSTLLTLSKRN